MWPLTWFIQRRMTVVHGSLVEALSAMSRNPQIACGLIALIG